MIPKQNQTKQDWRRVGEKCKYKWNELEGCEILNEVWSEERKERSWSEISAVFSL